MLAIEEPGRIYIEKPNGDLIQRQIGRMIKHLRDQYHEQNPLHSMPSSWLIDQLVINGAKQYILQKNSWQQRVRLTLEQIIRDTSYDDCLYINSRNNMPLFPNNELFDAWEVHQAMRALVNYLDDKE
jgi:hypothetical protein